MQQVRTMKGVKIHCLNCKFYRLKTVSEGICRVDKVVNKNYPTMQNEDSCSRWQDCGQQYYIRVGWIKGKTAGQDPAKS